MAFLSSQLHVSVPLTDLAVAFRAERKNYLWSKLLPPKVVSKRSDLIRQISKAQLLRTYELRAGKGGSVTEIQFKIDQNLSFNCVDFAVEAVLSSTESAEADAILEYEAEQIYGCAVAMDTNIEILTVRDTLRDTAILTQNVTLLPANYWDNYNSLQSNPIEDLKVACLKVFVATGHMPNVIVMHAYVWDRVQRHPSVLARGGVHPTGNAIVTLQQFEQILGVEPGTIHVTANQYNAAREDQTPDYRAMIGGDTIVAYCAPPADRSYSLGYSFQFNASSVGGSGEIIQDLETPFVVYEFPDVGLRDPRGATIHRLVGGLDQKVLVPEAGYLIKSCVDVSNTNRYGTMLQS
jgi:hypothetical protein